MTTVDPRIPAALHELWSTLNTEVVWLHGRWIIYRQLFGTSPERVAILNRSAGTFFNILQQIMLHDVQLSLSKLGDPVRSGVRKNRKNLTLATLVEGFKECGEQAVVAKLELHLKTFNTVSKDLRRRRNKWIAHFDLKTMLGSTAKPLEGPSRDEIDAVLDALRQFMNCVQSHYLDTETMYEHFVMNSDGEQLVSTLMQGLRYRELVEEQKIPFEDLIKTLQNGR